MPRARARARGGAGNRRSGGAEGGLCRARACERDRRRAARTGGRGGGAIRLARARTTGAERPDENGPERSSSRSWRPAPMCCVGAFSDPDLGPVIAVGLGGQPSRPRRNGRVPAAAGDRRRGRRADRRLPRRRDRAGRVPGRRRARSRGAARADPALRAPARGRSPRWSRLTSTRSGARPNGCVVLDMRVRIERRRPVERVKTW